MGVVCVVREYVIVICGHRVCIITVVLNMNEVEIKINPPYSVKNYWFLHSIKFIFPFTHPFIPQTIHPSSWKFRDHSGKGVVVGFDRPPGRDVGRVCNAGVVVGTAEVLDGRRSLVVRSIGIIRSCCFWSKKTNQLSNLLTMAPLTSFVNAYSIHWQLLLEQ